MSLIQDAAPRVVVLDRSAVPDLDYSVLRALEDVDERLRVEGITLWVAALNPDALHVFLRRLSARPWGGPACCSTWSSSGERPRARRR